MNADASIASQTLLEEIDAQQNELLDQLDALNARIQQVLKANSACFVELLSTVAAGGE